MCGLQRHQARRRGDLRRAAPGEHQPPRDRHLAGHEETAGFIDKFRGVAIPAEAIAKAIAFAIDQPDDVDVNEIIVRPTASLN